MPVGVGKAGWPTAIGYVWRFPARHTVSRNLLRSMMIAGPTEVTAGRTRVDGSAYAAQKRAALAAHASQLEGTFFLKFPDEAFAKAFGAESFIRERDTTGAPLPEDDFFAGLR